jgi:hypothetical protein
MTQAFGVVDDRANILPGDKSVLIVEDDRDFAQWLLDLTRQKDSRHRHVPRQYRAGARPRVLAGRDYAGHQPAGHQWLEGARSPEDRS